MEIIVDKGFRSFSQALTIPMTSHDISLDLFTTPDQLISCQRPFARPPRVLWNEVDEEKTRTIPVLRERRRGSR